MSNLPSIIMPNFKPTKWKVETCQDCTLKAMQSSNIWYKEHGIPDANMSYYCSKQGHSVIKRDNIPFFVPDMRMTGIGHKGWMHMKSDISARSYNIGPTKLEEVILNAIINKGVIPNQWWMYCKLGSSLSLKLVL